MNSLFTPGDARRAVAAGDDGRYGILLEHGTMELGWYAPRDEDPQEPHDRDELYFVASGHGEFLLGDERLAFAAGDSLFVPAGAVHRFENFSRDFAAWVVFYGPRGGEAGVRQ